MFPLYNLVRLFTILSTEEIKDQGGPFIVTSMSPGSAAFLKAYSVHGQPHGPWQYLGTFSVPRKG